MTFLAQKATDNIDWIRTLTVSQLVQALLFYLFYFFTLSPLFVFKLFPKQTISSTAIEIHPPIMFPFLLSPGKHRFGNQRLEISWISFARCRMCLESSVSYIVFNFLTDITHTHSHKENRKLFKSSKIRPPLLFMQVDDVHCQSP
jgi:hypothetical protein